MVPRLSKHKAAIIGIDTANLTVNEIAVLLYGGCTKNDVCKACSFLRRNNLQFKRVKTEVDADFKQQVIEMAKKQPLYTVVSHFYGKEYQRHYAKIQKWLQKAGVTPILIKSHRPQPNNLKASWDASKIEMVRAAAQRFKKTA